MRKENAMRCTWCGDDPQYVEYHDKVWGRPVYDARELFEKLCLDGQQAGLSWITILRKQANYQAAFANFEPAAIAKFDQAKIEALMQDSGIVRNRLKIQSVIKNAKGFLAYEQVHGEGAFATFLWSFVDGKPVQNTWQDMSEVPAETEASKAMSKALKKMGFSFIGPTICYAFMQAVGMVNDHLVNCPAYSECKP
jgi:DNA-3-methyladenine glycosylase I